MRRPAQRRSRKSVPPQRWSPDDLASPTGMRTPGSMAKQAQARSSPRRRCAILLAAAQNQTRGAHCVARAGCGAVGGEEGGEGGGGQGGDARRCGGQARARAAAQDAQERDACCGSGAERDPHARRRQDACKVGARGVRAPAGRRRAFAGGGRGAASRTVSHWLRARACASALASLLCAHSSASTAWLLLRAFARERHSCAPELSSVSASIFRAQASAAQPCKRPLNLPHCTARCWLSSRGLGKQRNSPAPCG